MRGTAPQRAFGQQGAATLVVVMVLFFIMAMMAAFANRNLVFEQRIASNYYRAGLALETAEAGGEWVLNALNGVFIDASCKNSGAIGTSFRERYLNIGADRAISTDEDKDANFNPLNPASGDPYVAAGISTEAAGWSYQCPVDGVLVSPAPAAAHRLQPMFAVRFRPRDRAGVVNVEVISCTDIIKNCNRQAFAARADLAKTVLIFDAALVSALKVPPASPLTVRGAVDLGAIGLGLHNTDPALSGLLMQAGLSYQGSTSRLSSVPGTPARDALVSGDETLRSRDGKPVDMFQLFFGMSPMTYRQQPAMRELICADDCSAQLQEAYASGQRMLWVEGPAEIRSNITLGTATDPFLLVVNGALTLDGPMLLNGLIYARGNTSWNNTVGAQPAVLTGALLSDGDLVASGTADIVYHADLINTLSNRRGSFVRVPGSWSDGTE